MGCCGNKRNAWKQETAQNKYDESEANDSDQYDVNRSIVFEYTGKKHLSVKGNVSGKIYQFIQSGSKVEINYEDTFALMAEYDLRIAKG